MTLKNPCFPFIALLALGLFACTTNSNDSSLSLENFPSILNVGDTTAYVPAIKTARDAQGRLYTNSTYLDYYLVSDDTAIARILSDHFVVGVKAGTTAITARDDNSTLSSGKYKLTVISM